MADNIGILDATNVTRTVKTKDTAGVHTPYQRVETSAGVVVDSFAGPATGALTNRSGTITTGNTAQQVMAANSSRKYAYLLNPDTATERLWFSFDATAVAASPSLYLDPGDFYESGMFCPTGALSVIAATTAHPYTAKEG
jgi:hypothetical protein